MRPKTVIVSWITVFAVMGSSSETTQHKFHPAKRFSVYHLYVLRFNYVGAGSPLSSVKDTTRLIAWERRNRRLVRFPLTPLHVLYRVPSGILQHCLLSCVYSNIFKKNICVICGSPVCVSGNNNIWVIRENNLVGPPCTSPSNVQKLYQRIEIYIQLNYMLSI